MRSVAVPPPAPHTATVASQAACARGTATCMSPLARASAAACSAFAAAMASARPRSTSSPRRVVAAAVAVAASSRARDPPQRGKVTPILASTPPTIPSGMIRTSVATMNVGRRSARASATSACAISMEVAARVLSGCAEAERADPRNRAGSRIIVCAGPAPTINASRASSPARRAARASRSAWMRATSASSRRSAASPSAPIAGDVPPVVPPPMLGIEGLDLPPIPSGTLGAPGFVAPIPPIPLMPPPGRVDDTVGAGTAGRSGSWPPPRGIAAAPPPPVRYRASPRARAASPALICSSRAAAWVAWARSRAAYSHNVDLTSAATRARSPSAHCAPRAARSRDARYTGGNPNICSTPTIPIVGSAESGIAPRAWTPNIHWTSIGRPAATPRARARRVGVKVERRRFGVSLQGDDHQTREVIGNHEIRPSRLAAGEREEGPAGANGRETAHGARTRT